MVRSVFGDLVFPCRTECPDGPIGKLKNGGIIGAVSVPNLASQVAALGGCVVVRAHMKEAGN